MNRMIRTSITSMSGVTLISARMALESRARPGHELDLLGANGPARVEDPRDLFVGQTRVGLHLHRTGAAAPQLPKERVGELERVRHASVPDEDRSVGRDRH